MKVFCAHISSKGSLVIDHDVETKNIENVTQALTVAVVQMASPKTSPLVFDGKNVSVTGLIMNNVNGNYSVFYIVYGIYILSLFHHTLVLLAKQY